MAKRLEIRAGQKSVKGIKDSNDDCSGIHIPKDKLLETKGIAAAIADGVSSSVGGREASECCVLGFLNDYYSTPQSWTTKNSGKKILHALNNWLYGESIRRFGDEYDMITTLSVLVLKSTSAHIFHVGDSRVYRLRDGEFDCLTEDHRHKAISSRDILSRAMGIDTELQIDYKNTSIEEGDIFLLTTDGVHDFLTDSELKDLLTSEITDTEKICAQIVKKAADKKSTDNITCQILIVDEIPEADEDEFFKHLLELPFPPPLSEGNIFEGYKIIRELHASNKTQVYLVVDNNTGREMVLKTPSVNYSDNPEYINSFINEEWAGKCVHSPHILKVIDSDRKKLTLYYLTEYVEGKDLRQWMDDNPNPNLTKVRDIINQISRGLESLHRKEIIHMDLKPENIMIDNLGTVKIIDFGSVSIGGLNEVNSPIDKSYLTGTVNYSAPESLEGNAGTIQSDIYSLAVITYELLTGKYPFGDNDSYNKKSFKKARYRHLTHINKSIPRWIDGAIERALDYNPLKRHEAPSEFVFELNKPNNIYLINKSTPLIERDPLMFWKVLALIFGIIALAELLILTSK